MRFFRGITPTDIDGAIEIDGKVFMFFEIKYGEKDIDTGQRLFLERMVDRLNKTSKAIAIHAKHNIDDWEKDVDVSICNVVKYYSLSKTWIKPDKEILLKQLCDSFVRKYGDSKYLDKEKN